MIGKQINFFFTPTDEEIFLAEVKKQSDIFVTDKDEKIDMENTLALNKNFYKQVWIKAKKSKIYCSPNGFLDRDKSEVITYTRSISSSFFKSPESTTPSFNEYLNRKRNNPINVIVFYNGKFIKESELPTEALKNEYESLRQNKDTDDKKPFQPSRLWAAMRYVENSIFIEKDKWFKDWYSLYATWIKKYCILGKDKDYYIGKEAYIEYKKDNIQFP